jgi:hypothetical protein
MSEDKRQSDNQKRGSSPRRIEEGAKPSAGSSPARPVKPPTSGPSGGAGDSGASED